MKKSLIFAVIAFVVVELLGFFCAWIGGIAPYTTQAGFSAVLSIFIGAVAAFFVFMEGPSTS